MATWTAGAGLGALNFVFMPWLAPFAPIWGLGPLVAFGAIMLAPAALLTLALARKRELPRLALAVLWIATGPGIGTVGGSWWFRSQREAALQNAIAYCDALRPRLESFQRLHGRFPPSLNELANEAPRPLLALTRDLEYRASPDQFEFKINIARGLSFHGACFDSRAGEWSR